MTTTRRRVLALAVFAAALALAPAAYAVKAFNKHRVITAGDLAGNVTSTAIRLDNVDNVGFEVVTAAAWNGVWAIEVSANSTNGTDGNFAATNLDAAAPASAAGASVFTIRSSNVPFGWARLTFTRTSGSGAADAWANSKGGG